MSKLAHSTSWIVYRDHDGQFQTCPAYEQSSHTDLEEVIDVCDTQDRAMHLLDELRWLTSHE